MALLSAPKRRRLERTSWSQSLKEESQWQMLVARRRHESSPKIKEITNGDTINEIEQLVWQLLEQLITTGDAELQLYSRSSYDDIDFDMDLYTHSQREDVEHTHTRFKSLKSMKTFVVIVRVLDLVHRLLVDGVHATKRDIYYTDVSLFKKQSVSDRAIEAIACLFHIPRAQLNVIGSERSLVAGRLRWEENGSVVDCMQHHSTGKAIPADISRLSKIQTDARFLLIAEDHATFMRLLNDNFLEKYGPCILLTGKGVPDVASRRLVRALKDQFSSLVVLALCDYDVWGFQILCTYTFGSIAMSYDAVNLATPEIKWLGLHDGDLKRWPLLPKCFTPLSEKDRRKGELMLSMPALQAKPKWRKQLTCMLECGQKMELQALSSLSISFLCDTFIPTKIADALWL